MSALKVVLSPRDGLDSRALRGVDALRKGREYVVLEVFSQIEGSTLFRVEPISDDPSALFDSRVFSVTDTRIPSTWRFFALDSGSFYLCPERWCEMGFWESYYDKESWAVMAYEAEKERILQES